MSDGGGAPPKKGTSKKGAKGKKGMGAAELALALALTIALTVTLTLTLTRAS